MKIEQIYTGCLAQGAYFIESDGEAAVIDPLREIKPYIERAESENVKIKYVFETHFHADFVSGHLDLSKTTGASIVFGPNANPNYDAIIAQDNQEFKIGNVKIRVLHTPGHTMESTTYLLIDEQGKDHCIFSGDTLFIGDVGRPDLAQKSGITKEDLAGYLYDSLRNKIMILSDDVIVYPAHGAGSACGKNMSDETFATLGDQKKTNYALRGDMTREEFIKEVTDGLLPPPVYFPENVRLNKEGAESIDNVLNRGANALSPANFEDTANATGAMVLDTRNPSDFVKGFIPKSINIGLDGNFAPWVGALITDLKQELLIVADPGSENEAVTRLARVGFDNAIGYLDGGFSSWKNSGKEVDTIESIDSQEFASRYESDDNLKVIDVRRQSEYDIGHVENSKNTPLDFINEKMSDINSNGTTYIYCAGGYRSVIAASILKARGLNDLVDIAGGFMTIQETTIPCTSQVDQSTS